MILQKNLNQVPRRGALDLYNHGLEFCSARGIPISYIRVWFCYYSPKPNLRVWKFGKLRETPAYPLEWSYASLGAKDPSKFNPYKMGVYLRFTSYMELEDYGLLDLAVEPFRAEGSEQWENPIYYVKLKGYTLKRTLRGLKKAIKLSAWYHTKIERAAAELMSGYARPQRPLDVMRLNAIIPKEKFKYQSRYIKLVYRLSW